MSWKFYNIKLKAEIIKATIITLSVVFFFAASQNDVFAQRKFSKTYPASKNIRLQLNNRTGTVTVQGWNRNQVRIQAWLEKPIAKVNPQSLSGTILIDVVRENKGSEVGDANFTIYVPYSSTVDIETVIGNINVSNVQGGLVSAKITEKRNKRIKNASVWRSFCCCSCVCLCCAVL